MPDAHSIAVAFRPFGRGDRLRGCTACHVTPSPRHGQSQLLLGEELQRAVAFRVDGISEASVNRRKHGDNRARLVIVGHVFDLLANCKLRHRKLLFGFVDAIISPHADDRCPTMRLPQDRTMVVALMSHPAL